MSDSPVTTTTPTTKLDEAITKAIRPHAPPLPATREDLLARRKFMQKPTLNDEVDRIHFDLWVDEKYQALLEGVYDEQCVEGSLSADNLMAAMMIRDYALSKGNDYVAREKLATIGKALNVVLRRYGISRNERRNSIGGEIVGGNRDFE